MTRQNWYWDLNIPYSKIQEILKRENDPRFPRLAGALLARVQDPKQIFGLITPQAFCRRFRSIQKEITSDEWTKEKGAFWKATYLRLSKELQEKGEKIRKPEAIELDAFDRALVEKVIQCRKAAAMSQKELAHFMEYSQQFISGIETGREKITVDFLKKLNQITDQRIDLSVFQILKRRLTRSELRDKILECCKKAINFLNDAKLVSEQTCLILSSFAVEEFGKALEAESILKATPEERDKVSVPAWLHRNHDKKYARGMAYLREKGCRDVYELWVFVPVNTSDKNIEMSYVNDKTNEIYNISITAMTTGWFKDSQHVDRVSLSPGARRQLLHVAFDHESPYNMQLLNTENIAKGWDVKIQWMSKSDVEQMIKYIKDKLSEYL